MTESAVLALLLVLTSECQRLRAYWCAKVRSYCAVQPTMVASYKRTYFCGEITLTTVEPNIYSFVNRTRSTIFHIART